MATYLDRIVARHRELAESDRRPLSALHQEALEQPPTRGFRSKIAASSGLAVIAEIKRRSPSKGDLNVSLDAAQVAIDYERGGACCMSVLTDEHFFGGSVGDLQVARSATSLPVLRKDFTVSERDVLDTRLMGADCVLLIAAALSDDELQRLHTLGTEVGLDVLVEVHDEAELERALQVGSTFVGVNQRDLITFEVDHERATRMAQTIPAGVIAIAESGVSTPTQAGELHAQGYRGVLIGESLVTADDRAAAVAAMIGGANVG